MVHVSAIGADPESESDYARSKAMGEAGILQYMPSAVILRPSIIFGPEDQFFNRFASMTKLGPILPVVGADTKFQPVYVDDVARAAEKALTQGVPAGVYELGGPDVKTFRALMQDMLDTIHRRRLILNVPFFAARIMAFGFDLLQTVSGGLIKNGMITRDQVKNLARDNVVTEGMDGFGTLGIRPASLSSVLPEYLWRFRPSGQYDSMKRSAKNLRS
jgi:NADH dehydrogenase